MRIFIVLLFIFSVNSFANDSLHLELINGSWNCSEVFTEDEVTVNVVTLYTYNSADFTYTYSSNADMLYQNEIPVGSIKLIESGTFTYSSAKMIYTLESVESHVLEDPMEAMTDELIKDMETDLKNDKTAYQTSFINKLEWETIDPTDNSKSVCARDITSSSNGH